MGTEGMGEGHSRAPCSRHSSAEGATFTVLNKTIPSLAPGPGTQRTAESEDKHPAQENKSR